MKTAIYIEDGTVQLVLTPESEFEKNALSLFREKPMEARIFSGTFYDCRGGWVRQNDFHTGFTYGGKNPNDESLILRYSKPQEPPTP